MAKAPKNPIVHDDENMTVKVIDSGVDETLDAGDALKIGVTHVEIIKAILQCEETIKFQRDTIVGLKKLLVEKLGVDAGFVADLIGVVKKEVNPETGGGVIEMKTKILDAAEQAVVLYPNVVLNPALITGIQNEDGDGAGSSVKPLV